MQVLAGRLLFLRASPDGTSQPRSRRPFEVCVVEPNGIQPWAASAVQSAGVVGAQVGGDLGNNGASPARPVVGWVPEHKSIPLTRRTAP
jgi:hypothetical protein